MTQGQCEFCGKEFERPHLHKTETEGIHIRLCHLNSIKEQMSDLSELDEGTKLMFIDELNQMSHVNSFGAKKGNHYYDNMLECKRLIKLLKESMGE